MMNVAVSGDGRPLVYLHPAGGVRWTPVLRALAETHKIYMPTFHEFDSRRALANLVADYLEREIGKPCDVIGWSSGGAVALWLAIDRPACVDHLVLECPAGLQTISPAKKAEEIEAQNRKMLAYYGAEDGLDSALLENLFRVESTTLILHGTEDRIIGKESVQLLKSKLRRAYLVYLWDAAHDLELDQPERTLALVRSFLERSDAFMVNYA